MPAQQSPRRNREQQKRERDRRDRRPTTAATALTGGPEVTVGDTTPFETLLRIIRVHKLWVLQGLIIVPLLVMAATLTQDKAYTATANLQFHDDPSVTTEQATG